MSVSPKQAWSAARATKRVNIWEGAVRSGKTWGSFIPWGEHVMTAPPGLLFMIGKTVDALGRNVLQPMEQMLGRKNVEFWVGKRRAQIFGRDVELLSAHDEASYKVVRGSTCAGWYGDELTLWPQNFLPELLSRMSPPGSKGFGTTNPDGPFHPLKKDYLDRAVELNWRRFRFRLDDNPFLDEEYVRQIKKEYVGLWYKRFILGLWVQAAGAVYEYFDEDRHLRKTLPAFPKRAVAVDYGTVNPTVFGLFGYGIGQKAALLDLHYYDGKNRGSKTDRAHADDFDAFVQGQNIEVIVVDPSAQSFIQELRERGYDKKIRLARNDVVDGIRFVAKLLGGPGTEPDFVLYDTPAMRPAIEEFGSYLWDEKAQEKGLDEPTKEYDHVMDMIRYFLYTILFRKPDERKFAIVT